MAGDKKPEEFDAVFRNGDDYALTSAVTNAIWDHYGIWLDYSRLPEECQTVVLTRAASGLIGNGSFYHLFEGEFNGDPCYLHTLAAYERLDLQSCAEVLRRVLAFFPNSRPPDVQDVRLEIFENVDSNLIDKLEKQFYECDATLDNALAKYIRANKRAYRSLFDH